jgi:hypothetical protein
MARVRPNAAARPAGPSSIRCDDTTEQDRVDRRRDAPIRWCRLNGEGRPGNPGAANQLAKAKPESSGQLGQIRPVDGPHPVVDVLYLGALLWSPPAAIVPLMELVRPDDVGQPTAATLLEAIYTLATSDRVAGPQLVMDHLSRRGLLTGAVAEQLRRATVCGAESAWRREYGAGVLADALRRRMDSCGAALVAAGRDAAEADLAPMVDRAACSVRDCADRLAILRGES